MSGPDLLDHRLTQAFDRAHEAQEWASASWPDPVVRVRRAAARARARRVAVGSATAVALVGGAIVAAQTLPGAGDQLHYRVPPASGGGDTHTGGDTGAKWLLSPTDYQQYLRVHPTASPAPNLVPSPAPPDAELTRLQANIAAALPAGTQTIRADAADGGVPGHATVWLRLADNTPVDVQRYKLDYPLVLATSTDPGATEEVAPENFTDPRTWDDGTAYTVVTGKGWGYGFDESTQWSGPYVWTVTPDGWYTLWTAPLDADTLLTWARSADASFAAG